MFQFLKRVKSQTHAICYKNDLKLLPTAQTLLLNNKTHSINGRIQETITPPRDDFPLWLSVTSTKHKSNTGNLNKSQDFERRFPQDGVITETRWSFSLQRNVDTFNQVYCGRKANGDNE